MPLLLRIGAVIQSRRKEKEMRRAAFYGKLCNFQPHRTVTVRVRRYMPAQSRTMSTVLTTTTSLWSIVHSPEAMLREILQREIPESAGEIMDDFAEDAIRNVANDYLDKVLLYKRRDSREFSLPDEVTFISRCPVVSSRSSRTL